LEFAFMFVAWPLYLVHAVFTGLSMVVANLLDIHLAFFFSAGGIDYLLNMTAPAASNAWMLIPIGLVFAVIYYFTFKWIIVKFNMKTPGREDDDSAGAVDPTADPGTVAATSSRETTSQETTNGSPSAARESTTDQEHAP